MNTKKVSKISKVPTNIITGFLGVGKTSAILHLLKAKPENERWAVLVNEFGEIGIDGSIMQGRHSEQQNVFIREVPGGCMCCASGLPMQIALNQLLAKAKPDRLLIEPTGLGHPLEVLEVLSDKFYREILQIEKVITLVDARKVKDERYRQHETFQQQIKIADVIVANKQDLYQAGDQQQLTDFVEQLLAEKLSIYNAEQGQFDAKLLQGSTEALTRIHRHHHGHHDSEPELNLNDMPIPAEGFIKAENQGQGFVSVGWRFATDKVFHYQELMVFLTGLEIERLKAVFITERGIFAYNLAEGALTEMSLDECVESRVEIIARQIDDHWQQQLMACLT